MKRLNSSSLVAFILTAGCLISPIAISKNGWLPTPILLVGCVLTGVASVIAFLYASRVARVRIYRFYRALNSAWMRHWPLPRGGGLIYRLQPLMQKLIPSGPVRYNVERGVSLLLDQRDVVARRILVEGEWEPQIWRAIAEGLAEGAVFVDVGAHIGYYSLRAAVRVGRTGKVIAFEPNPDTLEVLRANVASSCADNVTIEPFACVEREQAVTLFGGPPTNSGSSSLSRESAELDATWPPKQFLVRGRTVDDLASELALPRIDVLKVDAEGAEYRVLCGAGTLKRFHPKLIVELVPSQLERMHTTLEDVLSLIKDAGYVRSRRLSAIDWEWTVQ